MSAEKTAALPEGPRPGETAPLFAAPALGEAAPEGVFDLSRTRGRWVALYFYPKDDTTGCTLEAQEFTALKAEFAASGALVVGVSRDPLKAHEKFRLKHGLDLDALVSDPEGEVCQAYGVWVEKSMYGKKYMGIERATWLIDPEGVVRRVWRKVKPEGHAAEALKVLRAQSA